MVVSVWLLPPSQAAKPLSASMRSFSAKHGLPFAPPHVTLLGDVGQTAAAADALLAKLEALRGVGPVHTQLTEIAAGVDADGKAPWNQSAVAVVEATPAILNIQARVHLAFRGEEAVKQAPPAWPPPIGKPHLSLAYGSSAASLAELKPPPPFEAAEIALWDATPATLEGVVQWRELGRVPL